MIKLLELWNAKMNFVLIKSYNKLQLVISSKCLACKLTETIEKFRYWDMWKFHNLSTVENKWIKNWFSFKQFQEHTCNLNLILVENNENV